MVTAAGQQRLAASYCSATLGRHRQADLKRAEPNIYSQVIPMIDNDCVAETSAGRGGDDNNDNVGMKRSVTFMSGYSTKV